MRKRLVQQQLILFQIHFQQQRLKHVVHTVKAGLQQAVLAPQPEQMHDLFRHGLRIEGFGGIFLLPPAFQLRGHALHVSLPVCDIPEPPMKGQALLYTRVPTYKCKLIARSAAFGKRGHRG